jgi:hypothetical protein
MGGRCQTHTTCMTKHVVKYTHHPEQELTYNVVLPHGVAILDLMAICFKFHDQIKHHSINFQSMTLGTAQGDMHFCAYRHSMQVHPNIIASVINAGGLLPNAHTVSEPMCPKRKGLLIDVPFYPYIFYMHSTVYKCKGLLIDVLFYPYTFYMRNITYKKQRAPNRRPILFLYFLHAQRHVQKVRGS